MPTLTKQLGLRIVVVISVLLGSLTPAAVLGQDVTVERSGSIDTGIGDTIFWQSPWESGGEQPIANAPDVSVVMTRYDQHFAFVAQGTIADAAALREAMHERVRALQGAPGDAAVDDPVTVDSSVADPVSYWLDLIAVEGAAYGSFALARTGAEVEVLTVFIGPVGEFADGFADAQAGLRIGDGAVFDGVDGDGLQALLEENLSMLPEASPVAPKPWRQHGRSGGRRHERGHRSGGRRMRTFRSPMSAWSARIPMSARSSGSPSNGRVTGTSTTPSVTRCCPTGSTRQTSSSSSGTRNMTAWMIIFVWPNFEESMEEFVDYAASSQATLDTYGEGASVAMSGASPTLGAVVTLIDEGAADPALIYEEYHVSADGGGIHRGAADLDRSGDHRGRDRGGTRLTLPSTASRCSSSTRRQTSPRFTMRKVGT